MSRLSHPFVNLRSLLSPRIRLLPFAACLALATGGTGCGYFRTIGTGAHMDKPRDRPTSTDDRTRVMVVEVTTDAQGAVANITFKRSSGKDGVDAYVAETIRQGWPAQPSLRTVAEVTYSQAKGFSEPKVLSSSPAL